MKVNRVFDIIFNLIRKDFFKKIVIKFIFER